MRKKIIILLIFITLIIPVIPIVSSADTWWNGGWDFRKLITIDPSKVSGSSDLINFPVLVKFTGDADIGAVCQTDIDDLRFVSIDNTTEYYFEIENYSITDSKLYGNIWVNITSVSHNIDTRFWFFMGMML